MSSGYGEDDEESREMTIIMWITGMVAVLILTPVMPLIFKSR